MLSLRLGFLMTLPQGEWSCPFLSPCDWQLLFIRPVNSNLISQVSTYHSNLTSSRRYREKLSIDLFLLGSLVTASHILWIYFINILEFYLG